MSTWGLPNYSVFHSQPQTEPFGTSPGPQRPPAPPERGTLPLRLRGDRLGASASSSTEWAKDTTGLLAQRTSEGWLALFQARPFPASLALTPASGCMPPRLERSLPPFQQLGWLDPQAPHSGARTPWVGVRTGRGPKQVEQFCDGDREDGEREEGAHLCPPPPCWPAQGEAPAPAREGGQTVVLSLASGRPAPHNDPFIRLREPWAGVSSDKGGRPASCPLARGVGGGASSPI